MLKRRSWFALPTLAARPSLGGNAFFSSLLMTCSICWEARSYVDRGVTLLESFVRASCEMAELERGVCSAFFTASSANELNPEHIFFFAV